MKIKKFWADVKAATPKIYQWICGILVGLSSMAVTMSLMFNNLPASWQSTIPETVLRVLAGIALVGAAFAKKVNVKDKEAS